MLSGDTPPPLPSRLIQQPYVNLPQNGVNNNMYLIPERTLSFVNTQNQTNQYQRTGQGYNTDDLLRDSDSSPEQASINNHRVDHTLKPSDLQNAPISQEMDRAEREALAIKILQERYGDIEIIQKPSNLYSSQG